MSPENRSKEIGSFYIVSLRPVITVHPSQRKDTFRRVLLRVFLLIRPYSSNLFLPTIHPVGRSVGVFNASSLDHSLTQSPTTILQDSRNLLFGPLPPLAWRIWSSFKLYEPSTFSMNKKDSVDINKGLFRYLESFHKSKTSVWWYPKIRTGTRKEWHTGTSPKN